MNSVSLKFRRLLKRLHTSVEFARQSSELHVEFANPSVGFFSQMNFCLYAARIARLKRKRLFVTLSSANYRDSSTDPCWFHYYFEEQHNFVARPDVRKLQFWGNEELPMHAEGLSLQDAHTLFFETFRLRCDMQQLLGEALTRLAIGSDTLGVHFRATDKHSEADPVDPDRAVFETRVLLSRLPGVRNLFVASDNAEFVARMHFEIHEVPVVSLDDSARSNSDKPIHINPIRDGNRAIGRDALLNSLVLSNCGWLLRTSSLLSAWSSIFNPNLKNFLLNEPHQGKLWFPESLVMKDATMLRSLREQNDYRL